MALTIHEVGDVRHDPSGNDSGQTRSCVNRADDDG